MPDESTTFRSRNIRIGDRAVPLLAIFALLACLLAYGSALHGPLFFDDVPNLLENASAQITGGAFDAWRIAALSSDAGALHRPVAMLSFALNHALSGSFSAFSLKATNLAIHLAVAALVFWLARALLDAPALRGSLQGPGRRRLVAMLAAAIWLLHPIHVSTVLYAVQRMAQLSALFTLAGLLLFTRYRLRWAESGAGPGELAAACLWLLLCATLAILSKENGALLPWLAAVVEVTLFRGQWRGQSRGRLLAFGWLALALPLLLVALVSVNAPEVLTARYGSREFTLEERLLTQARVLWQYVSWLAVPNIMDMGIFHDDIPTSRSLWSPITTALSLLAWVAVLVFTLLCHRKYPLCAFAVLFYLVAQSMESTIFPLELVFEHRNYLPSVGLAVLAAAGIVQGVTRVKRLRLRAVAGGILGILLVLTAIRAYTWRDELTLSRFDVINHPESARTNFFYANALFKRFAQSGELGLSQDEQRALAVTSHRYFERMHRLDEEDFAALVMLYQLETVHFPGLAAKHDWLRVMAEASRTRRLKSSDQTALGALLEFSRSPAGAPERARVGEMLDDLVARHPWNMTLLAHQFRYYHDGTDREREALLASLERAERMNPGSQQVSAYLAQFHGSDDLATTYEAIREWMRKDRLRRELPLIRQAFEN
jgi:protein O-mannosyl-transferase